LGLGLCRACGRHCGAPRLRALRPALLRSLPDTSAPSTAHGCQGSGGAPTASAKRHLWETMGNFTLGSDLSTWYKSELIKTLWGFSAQLLGEGI